MAEEHSASLTPIVNNTREPLIETTNGLTNIAVVTPKDTPPTKGARAMVQKTTTTSAKGTPNAGRLLKKQTKPAVGKVEESTTLKESQAKAVMPDKVKTANESIV